MKLIISIYMGVPEIHIDIQVTNDSGAKHFSEKFLKIFYLICLWEAWVQYSQQN